ncbi:hypothetical protein [Lysobacter gummosus]|uniref:hypothetical protein n=1 Tax=Lysobacter gummosus TaxID=262324 RepID=UPI003635B13C
MTACRLLPRPDARTAMRGSGWGIAGCAVGAERHFRRSGGIGRGGPHPNPPRPERVAFGRSVPREPMVRKRGPSPHKRERGSRAAFAPSPACGRGPG